MSKLYPLQDDIGFIELIDYMGDDLRVVNNARVSYDKSSDTFNDRDASLLSYLIDPPSGPQHTSPLRGVVFTFRVKAPLYIARQWYKHHIASSFNDEQDQWNEKSLRYSKVNEEDWYKPVVFRGQHATNKQGSGEPLDYNVQHDASLLWITHMENAWNTYNRLLELGVSRDDARGVLPTCAYTSFIWTVGLQAVLNFIDLREGHGAQTQITSYCEAIKTLIEPVVPHTLAVWQERKARLATAKVSPHPSLGQQLDGLLKVLASGLSWLKSSKKRKNA